MAQKIHTKRTSDLFTDLIGACEKQPRLSLGALVETLGDRAFALAILIFCLPNCLPIPSAPGLSTITGLPMGLLALQMVLGRRSIWLPKRLAAKELPSGSLIKVLERARAVLRKAEYLLKPRLVFLCSGTGERILAAVIVLQAVILLLPLPFFNLAPGISALLLTLALLENDGVLAVLGVIASIGTLLLLAGLATAITAAVTGFFGF